MTRVRALSRTYRGTLLAIRKVAEVPGLRRGLDTLLFGPRSEAHG